MNGLIPGFNDFTGLAIDISVIGELASLGTFHFYVNLFYMKGAIEEIYEEG